MNREPNAREPFVRVSKRGVAIPMWKAFGIRGIALAASLVICSILIYGIVKLNPLKVFAAMFEGAFGTNKRMWVMIRDMMMLLCISVGLAPAFKMRFWNIGAEGQILVGGIASAACMIYLGKTISTIPLMIIMLVFGTKKLKNIGADLGGAVRGFKEGVKEGSAEPGAPGQQDAKTIDVDAKPKA